MKIEEAMAQARLNAIRDNYDRLSNTEAWATAKKEEKKAMMVLECGASWVTLSPILKALEIEL